MTYLSDEKNNFFLGDGSRNEKGKSLKEFLEEYDTSRYKNPSSTVDTAVFTYCKDLDRLKVLLIKRRNHPSIGQWAIPGGFVEFDENIDDTAKRELEEETGVTGVFPLQVGAYGSPDRDPRTRIITTLYTALVPEESIAPEAGDDAKDAALFEISFNEDDRRASLKLDCKERDIVLSAEFNRVEIKDEFFPRVKYEPVSKNGVALDHESLILDAYLFIRKNAKRNER